MLGLHLHPSSNPSSGGYEVITQWKEQSIEEATCKAYNLMADTTVPQFPLQHGGQARDVNWKNVEPTIHFTYAE